ncbi:hypothetical protein AB0939_17270 [Streptomyces sp. NPDC006990]|uniref:hypothetical protein n=1 Tax=Streptomyces sp. NPDC006990 TaxID=3154481 RepID=UPI003456FFB2
MAPPLGGSEAAEAADPSVVVAVGARTAAGSAAVSDELSEAEEAGSAAEFASPPFSGPFPDSRSGSGDAEPSGPAAPEAASGPGDVSASGASGSPAAGPDEDTGRDSGAPDDVYEAGAKDSGGSGGAAGSPPVVAAPTGRLGSSPFARNSSGSGVPAAPGSGTARRTTGSLEPGGSLSDIVVSLSR